MVDPQYSHRPKPFGHEATLTLQADRLDVKHGRRNGVFLYRDLMEMQLTYAPTNIASDGYRTRLLTRQGKTISFTNLSWRSMAEMERHHAEYRLFVRELADRLTKGNPEATIWAGLGRIRYRLTIILTATSAASLIAIILYSIYRSYIPNDILPGGLPKLLGIMAVGTLAYLGWWMGRFLYRNQPRRCTPETLPEAVLPTPKA